MTEPPVPPPALDGLVTQTEASDYAADGFHHRHTAGADRMPEIARAFLDAGRQLEMLSGEDRRGDLQAIRLVYTFNRLGGAPDRHAVVVDLPPEIPGASAPSIASVYAAADWFEREVFDMYGVVFESHPNLKRILLPEDADFHPLLKNFGRMEDAAS